MIGYIVFSDQQQKFTVMKCQTKNCTNETRCNRKHCSTCRQRKWRKEHPFKYAWKNKRNKAHQRGVEFTLTLEQFKELWLKHPEKWELKKSPDVICPYDIHRKDNDRGYHIDNVEIIDRDAHRQIHREQPLVTETEAPF